MSWESSVEDDQIVNRAVREQLGGLHSAQCILCSLDFAEIELLQQQQKWHEATQRMIEAARSVEKGGAAFDVE